MLMFSTPELLADRRRKERGAALITTLLLATLLLAAGGALVLTTGMSATTAIDSTAEMQAYYGAEAGLQRALNAFHGNAAPTINFRKAAEPSTSNVTGDPATTSNVARMSEWLEYDNETSAYPSNAHVNGSIAYRIEVRDPDNSKGVTYSTVGSFNEGPPSITFGIAPNVATITFTPQTSTSVMAYPAISAQPFGTFTVTVPVGSSGATVPAGTKFRLTVNQTLPWTGNSAFYATVSGSVTSSSSNVTITFGGGNKITVEGAGYEVCATCNPLSLAAPGTNKPITAQITAPDPKRLIAKSTGFGPKGAQKVLEMAIDKSKFDLKPPAPIVIRGADPRTVAGVQIWDPMTFDLGSSAAHVVSGADSDNVEAVKPAVAISFHDWTRGNGGIKKGNTVNDPELSILDTDAPLPAIWPVTLTPIPGTPGEPMPLVVETPDFLKTATKARAFVADLRRQAKLLKRYYENGFDGTSTSDGTTTGKPVFTFVEGDCELDGGAGMLVITGNLRIKGNRAFSGIILVLGTGNVTRSGGGGGDTYGSWLVARFGATGDFLPPTFDVSGGGGSSFRFSSEWAKKANTTAGIEVLGIAER
jgi:hypothetical protein